MRLVSSLTCLLLTVNPVLLHASTAQNGSSTNWQLESSMKYDALCLLKVLSGDSYYLYYYQAEYDHFHPLFAPEEQAAFTRLKHAIKDEGHEIISAKLAIYYSAVDDETLPEMIRTAHDSSAMEAALRMTSPPAVATDRPSRTISLTPSTQEEHARSAVFPL